MQLYSKIVAANSIFDFIRRDDKLADDLKDQYKRATTQVERDRIHRQLNDADRDFLANEKLQAGLKLYYAKDFNGAIKCYNEALEFNPNFADAYNARGIAYDELGQYEQAVADYTEAKTLGLNG